jgi:serine/threonine protein kinase
MGIVYVVLDHETGELLAAKTYRDDVLAADPELAVRFEREALTWINLDPHPNVVKAKYFKIVEHKPFLFLEFAAGGNLQGLLLSLRVSSIDDSTPHIPDFSRIQDLAVQFCDGMIHLSKCGIKAHRDIKAANCLVAGQRGLKITDFGLAKVFDDAVPTADAPHIVRVPSEGSGLDCLSSQEMVCDATLSAGMSVFATRTGVGAGTPTHMAPEQFDDVKRVDVRADIYSFGVMLFQLLTGRLPFSGGTWLDYRRLHKTMRPPEIRSTLPAPLFDMVSEYDSVVARCLAKDPRERFASFLELRRAILKLRAIKVCTVLRRTHHPVYHQVMVDNSSVVGCVGWASPLGAMPTLQIAWGPLLGETYPRETYPRETYPPFPELGPAPGKKPTEDELLHKALSLVELGQHQQALRAFDQAIERNPKKGRAWVEKGLLLMNTFRRFDKALASLEEAQRLGEQGLEEYIARCRKQLP